MTTSRLSSLLSTVESSTCPPVVARILLRGSTIVRYLSDGEERRRKPSGFVMPAGSFLGVGQSNSPASSTSYDTASIVDTPFFMPQGSLVSQRPPPYRALADFSNHRTSREPSSTCRPSLTTTSTTPSTTRPISAATSSLIRTAALSTVLSKSEISVRSPPSSSHGSRRHLLSSLPSPSSPTPLGQAALLSLHDLCCLLCRGLVFV